jgi:lipoprotein-anchoring transpeptidase ErfK/SrfK
MPHWARLLDSCRFWPGRRLHIPGILVARGCGIRRQNDGFSKGIVLSSWNLRQKRHNLAVAVQGRHLSAGIVAKLSDNTALVRGIVTLRHKISPSRAAFDWNYMMSSLKITVGVLAVGMLLSGCMETATYEATNTSSFKQRDKELLAKIRYENVQPPDNFRRAIVSYHRKEAPGSIVVDSDNHFLYFVLNDGKAIRYGITVGEEAMAWSGIAKIGSMAEWPPWHPTKSEIERLGVPTFVAPGPDNPMGSRALYLYSGGKDTLFRIHGTNQPEYIGSSISSGCIRMTNEDVIDLYNRVKMGTIVVVLEPHHGDSPWGSGGSQIASHTSFGTVR